MNMKHCSGYARTFEILRVYRSMKEDPYKTYLYSKDLCMPRSKWNDCVTCLSSLGLLKRVDVGYRDKRSKRFVTRSKTLVAYRLTPRARVPNSFFGPEVKGKYLIKAKSRRSG